MYKVFYVDKLNTIQWRNKRKKIFKRDNYNCTVCGSGKNLEVHHTYYYDDHTDPWKYPNKSLLTLCEKCHLEYHKGFEVEIRSKPKPKKGKKVLQKHKKQKHISLAEFQMIRGLRTKKRHISKNKDI